MHVRLKRAYDDPSPEDGTRVLVDRLWPRGVSRRQARVQHWAREIAPSTELRRWFAHRPERFAEFARRYRGELRRNEDGVAALLGRLDLRRRVTLVYAAKDREHNHAVALKAYLEGRVRPPGSGPTASGSPGRRGSRPARGRA